MTILTND